MNMAHRSMQQNGPHHPRAPLLRASVCTRGLADS